MLMYRRFRVSFFLAIGVAVTLPSLTSAQRVLLSEDFEFATPDHPDSAACLAEGTHTEVSDECIGADSVDTNNRSRTLTLDPAFATVTGGAFQDPFPESHQNFPVNNQSLVIRNPNSATQMAVNFFSIFPDDSNHPNFFLSNGVIEFDAYFDDLQSDGLWGFLGVRLGFELNPDDRNQVATTGDEVVWHSVRMQEGGLSEDPEVFDSPEDKIHDRIRPTEFFIDPNVIDQEIALHFRYELHGDGTYNYLVDNLNDAADPVMFVDNVEWKSFFNFTTFQEEPAPGINEISFMSDASGQSQGSSSAPNVYIDNLRIVDNLRAPHGPGERDDLPIAGQPTGEGVSFANVDNVLEAWEAKADNDGSWYEAVLGPGQNGIVIEVTDGALVELGMPSRRGFLAESDSYLFDPAGIAQSLQSGDRLVFENPVGPGNAATSFTIGDIGGSGERSFPIFLAASGTSFTITSIGGDPPESLADFDGDGDVDQDDLAAWEAGYSMLTGATRANGDSDGDGDVDGFDFVTWQREFLTSASGASSAAAIPEPATLALLAAAALSMLPWKRRFQRASPESPDVGQDAR